MIVLDASVLIAFLDGQDVHHVAADAMLARTSDQQLAVNQLTLAEVLVAPTREDRVEVVRNVLDDLEVHELPLPSDAAVRLAELRTSTGLRMPDCCVLLSALDAGATLACFDGGLARAAERRGLRVLRQ